MGKVRKYTVLGIALLAAAVCVIFVYISRREPLRPDQATAVNVWYVDDGVMWHSFEAAVSDYNENVGAEMDITVEAVPFSSRSEMYDKLDAALGTGTGLPDMLICGADNAAHMKELGLTADLSTYHEEWDGSYLDEVMLAACTYGGGLCALPIAAETDVFMLNTELYSDIPSLSSLEKLCEAAGAYYDEEGKTFLSMTDYSSFFYGVMLQLGDSFDGVIPHDSAIDSCKYVYNLLANMAFERGYRESEDCIAGFAAGHIPCVLASSSDIADAGDKLSGDNYTVIPYPVSEKGKSAYTENTACIAVLSSDENSEKASVHFAAWFVSDEVNAAFTGEHGYLAAGSGTESDDSAVNAKLMSYMKEKRSGTVLQRAELRYIGNSAAFNEELESLMRALN